ncbi:hypothetical protein CCACVL1_08390 [Corchorus capsularis]|uniref:Uncharacterized protein n=1 Tax=Corchorus capsularis TaxID=210143 RepID=A0A1R3J0T5_COCAP|nr:hypothetical protein CCACVL1_08390 [Corchorus capsularis]
MAALNRLTSTRFFHVSNLGRIWHALSTLPTLRYSPTSFLLPFLHSVIVAKAIRSCC